MKTILFLLIINISVFANPKLNFKIDEDFLIAEILSRADFIEEIGKDYPWYKTLNDFCIKAKDLATAEEYAKICIFKIGYCHPEEIKDYNLDEYFSILKELLEYKVIYNDTLKYKRYCENQWEKNFDESYEIVKEITGIEFEKEFNIYLLHPKIFHGRYLGNNEIIWGAEPYKNITTAALWHEMMHSYLKTNPLTHAIIQLIDNEIEMRLNYDMFIEQFGHEYLDGLMQYLYVDWVEYLNSDNKDIFEFYEKMKEKVTMEFVDEEDLYEDEN